MDEPEKKLYKKFKLDEPWDSKHNIELLKEMPACFQHPDSATSFKTRFLGFEGGGTMFEPGKEIGLGQISDGTSNTIFLTQVNRQSAIEWTKPADIKFDSDTPVTQLAETSDGSVIFSLCDASTHTIKLDDLDSEKLSNLIQRNDGNNVSLGK